MYKAVSNKSTFLLVLILLAVKSMAGTLDSLSALVKSPADSPVIVHAIKKGDEIIFSNSALAKEIAEICLVLSKDIHFKTGEAISYGLMARTYNSHSSFDKAIANYLVALMLFEETNNSRGVITTCNEIALAYFYLRDNKRTGKYLYKAKDELLSLHGDYDREWMAMSSLAGRYYLRLRKLDSAYRYFDDAYRYGIRCNDKAGMALALDNVAGVYRLKRDFPRAEYHVHEAIKAGTELGDIITLVHAYGTAARIYADKGDFGKADLYVWRTRKIADSLDITEIKIRALSILRDYYKAKGDFANAYAIYDTIQQYRDTVSGIDKDRKIAELEVLYQNEKKENENVKLRKENNLKEIDLLNTRLQQRTMSVIIVFLLLMAAAIVYSLYRQSKVNERLTELNIEKNNIMAVLSHDLKSPLTKLHTYIQSFFGTGTDEKQREYLNRMKEVIHESSEMVQNLLDVTYIEERITVINISEIDLYEVIEQIISEHMPSALRKDMQILFSQNLKELVFNTDYQKFRRIIDNLLSNAVKYNNIGKSIYITVTDQDRGVLISIRDEGQGIDEEDKKMLFTKFSRLKSNATGGELSTGMGLYIVKNLCEVLEGKVWCESSPGAGSTFQIYLPHMSMR